MKMTTSYTVYTHSTAPLLIMLSDSASSVQYSAFGLGYPALSSRSNQALYSVLHRAGMKGFGELKP